MLVTPQQWADQELRAAAAVEVLERLCMACFRENLVEGVLEENSLRLKDSQGAWVSFPLSRSYSMDRFDLHRLPSGVESDRCFQWFLETFLQDLEQGRRDRLLLELRSSHLNLALSLKALKSLGSGTPGEGGLSHWEGKVWSGHPLHPGARLRSGLTAEENRLYGPEWEAELKLPLLSVDRSLLVERGNFSSRLASLYPRMARAQEGRALVPVHPWQARHDLPERFSSLFESGQVRFTDLHLDARPTMSFRSVILKTGVGEDFHLKLPVAVQTTGATRTVSVAATQNGPTMSEFLRRLFSRPEFGEARLFDHLHLCAEPASFHIKDEDPDRCRYFSAILRKGPAENRLSGKRWLLPAAALLEPRTNPLFVRAAQHYGVSPLALFTAYCRRLLPAQAYLCGQMGIALEAHPQNIVVDFRGVAGSPPDIHFWYRDLGGIRLHSGRLGEALERLGWSHQLSVPSFWPGSATATGSSRDLSSKFVYSLLQNHLGELIRSVSRAGLEESRLWKVVDDVLTEHKNLMGSDLKSRVFADQWDLKAMWTMRVDSAITEYTFRPVRNPLLESRKEGVK